MNVILFLNAPGISHIFKVINIHLKGILKKSNYSSVLASLSTSAVKYKYIQSTEIEHIIQQV